MLGATGADIAVPAVITPDDDRLVEPNSTVTVIVGFTPSASSSPTIAATRSIISAGIPFDTNTSFP
jgi:hypothetical protein